MPEHGGSPTWAEHRELVTFYTDHRGRPEDLYPSERRFLPWLATRVRSVLDVGCAAGNFRNIWRQYGPDIIYSGVDVSAPLIATARSRFPDSEFHRGDCAAGLPFPDGHADIAQALGWLHWEPRYRAAIAELWRVARRYVFFDVRLAALGREAAGQQQVAFGKPWDGRTTTPYLVIAWPRFAALLLELRPQTLLGYGYWGEPGDTVMGVDPPVCFAAFVLEKAPAGVVVGPPAVGIDLPLTWPEELLGQVRLVPSAELSTLADAP